MRLRLDTPDRTPYWLVGDPALNDRTEQSASLNEQIQVTRNNQTVSGADWESVLALDRGNQAVVITATTRREFISEEERMDFISAIGARDANAQLHRWFGTVIARIDSADGSTFKDYTLADSVVALTAMALAGAVGLTLTYQVRAGGFGEGASAGVSGEVFNLTATVPNSTFCTIPLAVLEAAIQARFDAGSDVVAFGVGSAVRNPSSSSRALRMDTPTVLFFKDATAYATYLGSSSSLYALANVGQWLEITPGSGIWSWRARQSDGSLRLGCVGFTLPISNAERYWPRADLGYFDLSQQGELLLAYVSDLFPSVILDLRLATLTRNSYGALVYTLHAPLASVVSVVSGEANLIGTSSTGADYNLTAYSSDT